MDVEIPIHKKSLEEEGVVALECVGEAEELDCIGSQTKRLVKKKVTFLKMDRQSRRNIAKE
ncbi:hypothetical protein E2C01_031877 [Portunus trituberculatus]|uniref:Uncharacterized protein n=1 Tax=Portunus trituberculatus TaxID=210409 RepID=A0A5B7EUK9_PORTR|nr:hypothetical protein [Portunus trituberculatus]